MSCFSSRTFSRNMLVQIKSSRRAWDCFCCDSREVFFIPRHYSGSRGTVHPVRDIPDFFDFSLQSEEVESHSRSVFPLSLLVLVPHLPPTREADPAGKYGRNGDRLHVEKGEGSNLLRDTEKSKCLVLDEKDVLVQIV